MKHTSRVLLGAFRGCTSYTLPYREDEVSRHRYSGSHVLVHPGLLLQLLKLHRGECSPSTIRDRCHKGFHFFLERRSCCSCNQEKKFRACSAKNFRPNEYKSSIHRCMHEYLIQRREYKNQAEQKVACYFNKFQFHVHCIREK